MTSEIEQKIPGFRELMAQETALLLQREGLQPHQVEPWEDGYRTHDTPNTFEWWYFDAEFDDGGKAVVVFNTRPQTHPQGPLAPSLVLIMRSPDGEKVKLIPKFKPEELTADPARCNVRLGNNHVCGDLDRYELHAEVESYQVDLVFTRQVPSWRPGAGINSSGKDHSQYFAWVVPVPYGKVEGTVVFKGQKRQVRGACYHDHNWGNVSPGSGIDHWYWGRAHVGDFTLIFVEMVSRHVFGLGALKLHTFLLARGEEILAEDGVPLALTTSDFIPGPGGRLYPEKLDWQWQGEGGQVAFSLRNPTIIESIDMLEGTSWWQRPLAQLFSHPHYYNFNADIDLTVDLNGVKTKQRGRALYELMMQR